VRWATLRDANDELLEGLKYSFSIQIGPRSQQNPILQVSSIIGGRSFLLYSWRLLLCSLRLRQKYQAPTANKKAEGTAVVYRSKFGSPRSQMGSLADILAISRHVRFGSEADMAQSNCNVRFTPNSGHPSAQSKCPLWARKRHTHRSKKRLINRLRMCVSN